MARVTVEGSQTPCVDLPTGVRKTVEYSRGVRDRVRRGYYLIVDGPTEDEVPPSPFRPLSDAALAMIEREKAADDAARARLERNPETLERLEQVTEADLDEAVEVEVHGPPDTAANPPAGNASGAEWAAFLRARGIGVPDGAGRDVMRELWRQADGER